MDINYGTKFNPIYLNGVNIKTMESQSELNSSSIYQSFNTLEELLGETIEMKIETLCYMLEGIDKVYRFEKGTVGDDDLKIDIAIKFNYKPTLIGFQVKSSEAGANQFIEKNKEGVSVYWKAINKRFPCPGVFWLSPKQVNLIPALILLRDWLDISEIKSEILEAIIFYDAVIKKHPEGVDVPLETAKKKLNLSQLENLKQLGVVNTYTPQGSYKPRIRFLSN